MADYAKDLVTIAVVFLMLGVGMRTEFSKIVEALKQFHFIGRGLLANFLVFPAFVWCLLYFLPLSPEVKIGAMLMAAAPVAPMAPPFVGIARGDVPYSVALMVVVGVLSVFLTPLILSFSLPETAGGATLDPMQIVKILLMAILIPIGAGMAIRQASDVWSERLLKVVPMLGQIGLVLGVGVILLSQAKQILTMGLLAHVVLLATVIVSLAIGHLALIDRPADRRQALAVCTAIRNIPLAFLIATQSYADTLVAPVTLIIGTHSMIFSVVYGKLVNRGNEPAKEES
jgi:BASS family bile acid:Na+ symporter